MPKYKPITEAEIEAAKYYLKRMWSIRMVINADGIWDYLGDTLPCCRPIKKNLGKHRYGIVHVASFNNMVPSRLKHVVQVVRVMDALDDKPEEEHPGWKPA